MPCSTLRLLLQVKSYSSREYSFFERDATHGFTAQKLRLIFLGELVFKAVFGCKIPNSKLFFRHLHGDLNLDEIKNTLRLMSVNGEMNLMNLIRL